VVFLAGNQYDLIESGAETPAVTNEEVIAMVSKNTLAGYLETSAKSGLNVEQLFFNVAKELLVRNKDKKELIKAERLEIQHPTPQKKKCCAK
jgi:GTPase SAR1 family protein